MKYAPLTTPMALNAQYKIQSMEEAIKSNAETQKEVRELKSQSDKMDERSKNIQESVARQERMIEHLLRLGHMNQAVKLPLKPQSSALPVEQLTLKK